ncbi:hypothetical protein ACHAWF_015096 [Thalassiosira exigua]
MDDDEGDGDDAMADSGGGTNAGHRTAALALRAVDGWCRGHAVGATKLKGIFASTDMNIIETIADALYSNAEIVIDAVSDLVDTLLEFDDQEAEVSMGISIAEAVMGNVNVPGMSDQLAMARQVAGENEKSRISILSDLVAAAGLQRFRFAERQARGDDAVCRCLARTAARIYQASRDLARGKSLEASPEGILDLLLQAASHPSAHVCGVAAEALAAAAASDAGLAARLLPRLQGKAIIPFRPTDDAGGFEDYVNFRDRVLTEALAACYAGCGPFYLESCASAIDEFCRASPSPHLPHQLEAALFCMVVIAEKASKAEDKLPLCLQLEKMVKALENNSFKTTAQPLVMARMCQFIGKFASCFKSCSSVDVFQIASKLVMASFDRGVSEYSHQGHVAYSSHISPLSEASDAIKQLLWASPDQFSPEARVALENAWKLPYTCQQEVIAIEDREMLSSGLCAVVVSLPAEQWIPTLDALAQPILSCLNVITREADQVTGSPSGVGQCEKPMEPMMNRLSNEIRLLASTVRNFIKAGKSKKFSGEDVAKMSTCHRNALVSLLHKSWPSLTHIGRSYCSQHDVIASAIGQLMSESLSYGSEEDIPLLLEITGLAKTSLIEVVKSKNADALAPLLSFMQKFILLHGSKIEPGPRNNATHEPIQVMAKNLMLLAYQAVRSCSKASKDSHVSHGMASPMFETLSACAKKCPIFLLGLSRDSQPVGEVVRSSIETSPTVLKSNEMDVVLSSIKYLKQLVRSEGQTQELD